MTEKFWLEVRVPQGGELDRANMEGVVNFAFNRGEALEFVVASTAPPERDLDRNSVRWFYGFGDEQTRSVMRTQLETEGFYVLKGSSLATPPECGCPPDFEREYPCVAELEATDHFAYGFLPRAGEPEEERTFEDYPPVSDRLSSAISRGGALRVIFEPDKGAESEAKREAQGAGKSEEGPLVNGMVDSFFHQLLSFGSGGSRSREKGRLSEEEAPSELELKMKRRANTGLFSMGVCAYGTPDQINSIIHSLPLSPVTFEVYESGPAGGGEGKMQPSLETGTKRWKMMAKKWSHLAVPLILALSLWYTGLWFPLRSFESFWNFLPIVGIAASAVLPSFIDFKDPIALSHDELTLFLSLPRKIDNIPREPGIEIEPAQEGR